MKKTKKLFLAACVAIVAIVLLITNTQSYAELENEPNVINNLEDAKCDTCQTEENAINPNSTAFICKDNAVIDTDIYGDVFVCAKSITIDSNIDGNLYACGENVKIENKAIINGSIFICSKYTEIQSGACLNLYNFSKEIEISNKAYIARDAFIASETVTLEGKIERDAFIGCKSLVINQATALIGNNLKYSAETKTENIENIVSGEVKFTDASKAEEAKEDTKAIFSPAKTIMDIAISIVTALAIALVMMFIAGRFTDNSVKTVTTKPWITLLYGFLGSIVIFVISIIAMCTIVGIKAGLLIMAIGILALCISGAVTTTTLSKIIANKMNKGNGTSILFVILITVIYGLLAFIPVVGGLIKYVYTIYGFGIILYTILKNRKSVSTSQKLENKVVEVKSEVKGKDNLENKNK